MPMGYCMKFLLNTALMMLILAISSQKVDCLRNFALKKLAYQSSIASYDNFNWTADKAVDGNINGSKAEHSRTCSATKECIGKGNHTWEVDIGFNIIVKTITVYGRNQIDNCHDYQLFGLKVFLGNSSKPWTSEPQLKEQGGSSDNIHVYPSIDSVGRFVSVVRWNEKIMALCEVKVEGECLDGVFSESCNLACGKCKEKRPCDKDNGACHGCENGTYGFYCQEKCGHCMRGNISCSTIDGHCKEGCQEGWKGETCKIELPDTAFTVIIAAAIGSIIGSLIVVAVMSVAVVIAVIKWKRRKVKTTQTTQLEAIESHDKDNVTSEIFNIGNAVSKGNVGYSKANANTALKNPASYEQLIDTAKSDASIYTVINEATKESFIKDKVSSSVNYAEQLLSIEKEMNTMKEKKDDLILKKRNLLKKLATSESIDK